MNRKVAKIRKMGRDAKKRTREIKRAAIVHAREKARRWRRMVGVKHMCIGALVVGLVTGALSYSGVLDTVDRMFSDVLYQAFASKRTNSQIRIIAIDGKTVKKYGNYQDWSRERTAKLLQKLNKNSTEAPSVIGLDLDFREKKDSEGDAALVKACSIYKNLCFSASAMMTENVPGIEISLGESDILSSEGNRNDGTDMTGEGRMEGLELPFDELLEQVKVGIVNNTRNSEDGYVRNAFSSVEIYGAEVDSFATAIYKMYMDSLGKEYTLPKLNEDGTFQFTFSKKSQEYTVYSFSDALEGKIAPEAFKDCAVLIGSYVQDNTFKVPNQRMNQMHEIEMQANILEALMEQRTGQETSKTFTAFFYAFFMAVFFIATSYSSGKLTVVIAILINVLQLFACWIINLFGYYVNILVPVIMIALISIYNLIVRYAIAIQNQYAMEDVFKKYVDQSVISELGKSGLIEAHVGVESKDIAVLFVDIRGFTSLSESLPPEQIVEILNAYLELVAQAVAKHQGTLDKFIGDAAMAVFNSPTDLDDYEFRAVCAALELRSNAYVLNEKCKKEYGKQVSFGIGIQCGQAVIGNIGCDMRMDFTAIGDTVNTASRLEGAAAPGQILVSREMMKRLQGRIQTYYVGKYTLKGKRMSVPAYEVEGIIDVAKPPKEEVGEYE